MGRSFRVYLAGDILITCKGCGNHLAVSESIMSRNFHGTHGKAYLVRHVVNTYTSTEAEDRDMRTGKHTVRDVFCGVCNQSLGWTYIFAYEPSEKYKEGRYILERERIKEKPDLGGLSKPRIEEVVEPTRTPVVVGRR